MVSATTTISTTSTDMIETTIPSLPSLHNGFKYILALFDLKHRIEEFEMHKSTRKIHSNRIILYDNYQIGS